MKITKFLQASATTVAASVLTGAIGVGVTAGVVGGSAGLASMGIQMVEALSKNIGITQVITAGADLLVSPIISIIGAGMAGGVGAVAGGIAGLAVGAGVATVGAGAYLIGEAIDSQKTSEILDKVNDKMSNVAASGIKFIQKFNPDYEDVQQFDKSKIQELRNKFSKPSAELSNSLKPKM